MKTIIMFCLWVLSMVMLYADEMNTKYIFAYFKGNGEVILLFLSHRSVAG